MTGLYHKIAIFVLGLTVSHKSPVPTYPAPMLSPRTLEMVKRYTVLISIEGFEGGYRGTGVLIDKNHVLTCAHMVHGGQMWVYTYPLGRVITSTPVWLDQWHDLAILTLHDEVNLTHYAVVNTTTTIGQPVVVVGNTLGAMQWFVSYGMISNKEGFYDETTALIRGGNSGGPWVDLSGNLVALTDWGLVDHKGNDIGIGGGIDGATIQKFLADWKAPNLFQILLGG
jgi:S1-C subfamily serine protease